MAWEAELALVERAARNLRLGFSVVAQGEGLSHLDRGLRTFLEMDWEGFSQRLWVDLNVRERVIYRIRDLFFCQYIALCLPGEAEEGTRVLVVGPYTAAPVSREMIEQVLSQRGGSPQLLPHIETFFTGIPVLFEDAALMAVLDALAEGFWGRDGFTVHWLELPGQERELPILSGDGKAEGERVRLAARVLEERYAAENQLLTAVSQGRRHDAERVLSGFTLTGMERRVQDPLRENKNYLIIFNTLLRKAAEQGGVHPLHLDRVSGRFARRIEEMGRLQEGAPLSRAMVKQYCQLVRERSLRAYSLPVQRLMIAIDHDLTADLTLSAQAARLGMNPSYLSDLFRQEMGMPYTEYVNRRRVEQGAILLRTTTKQVQVIAQLCGVPDVNYFARICKKYLGCTPGEYRRGVVD